MKRNELENAYTPIPDACYDALMNAAHSVQEEPVMKRKISAALVMALALILVACVAFAIATWRDTAQDIVATEQEMGYFQDWPVSKKTDLVRAIVAEGYLEETDAIAQLLSGTLPDAQAEKTADAALETFTGSKLYDISFMEIMQAAWGPFDKWTLEEQAWYSQLMVDMGLQGDDHTLYVAPTDPVDEAQAIAAARREITQGLGVEESALDAYTITTSFQVPEFAAPGDTQPYWYIEFSAPESMPQAERLFNTLWAFIHPETGLPHESLWELLAHVRERADYAQELTLTREVAQSLQDNQGSIQGMYAFRQAWEPSLPALTKAAQTPAGEVYSPYFLQNIVALLPQIGQPVEGTISRDAALAAAEAAIPAQLGWPQSHMDLFATQVEAYLTLPGHENPVYQFIFTMRQRTGAEMNGGEAGKAFDAYMDTFYATFDDYDTTPRGISIRIDAKTGEPIATADVIYAQEDAYYLDLLFR